MSNGLLAVRSCSKGRKSGTTALTTYGYCLPAQPQARQWLDMG